MSCIVILVNHIESLFQSVLGAREKIAMVNTIYKYMYMYWYLPSHKNDNYVKYLIITYLHAVLLIFTEKTPHIPLYISIISHFCKIR